MPGARLALVLVTACAVLAGCLGGSAPVQPQEVDASFGNLTFAPAVAALEQCQRGTCFETTVAVDADGRIFVTDGAASGVARSDDGGVSFSRLPAPPMPDGLPPVVTGRGDAMVHAGPDGRLWFTALLFTYTAPAVTLLGIQVTASEDGGASWSRNAYLPLSPGAEPPPLGADRQWLTFGDDGTLYLTYQRLPPVLLAPLFLAHEPGIRVARSDDGGRTWSAFASIHPEGERYAAVVGGQPAARGDVLVVPHFVLIDGESRLRLAVSTDRAATFERVDAFAPPSGERAGAFFPAAGFDDSGGVVLAWRDGEERLVVSRSADGGRSWPPPTPVREGPLAASPWLAVRGGEAVLAWLVQTGEDTARLEAAILPLHEPDAWAEAPVVTVAGSIRGYAGRGGNTDFAHLDLDAAGRAVLAWSDRDAGKAFVRVETA